MTLEVDTCTLETMFMWAVVMGTRYPDHFLVDCGHGSGYLQGGESKVRGCLWGLVGAEGSIQMLTSWPELE